MEIKNELKEVFKACMEGCGFDLDYSVDNDGDFTDKFTAMMYLSFVNGVEFAGKMVELKDGMGELG